tara:strand:+ start:7327 stop:8343 length:1017 start_codon:yes stop_codon:yes gene_type:complete
MSNLLGFPREIGLHRSLCKSRSNFDRYVKQVNGKASCYTSLFSFRDTEIKRPWKTDTSSAIIDRAWWDFDSGERGGIEQVKVDTAELINRLSGDVRVVATGRGFHVHELFEKPVIGSEWARHLDRYQRERGKGLATLDGVGHPQKLTRIPDTFNIKRWRWAVNIDLEAFMADPQGYVVPTRPDPNLSIHDPYRGRRPAKKGFSIIRWAAENPLQERVALSVFNGTIGTAEQVPIPPCIDKGIRVSNPSHDIRVALVQHMAENLRWFSSASSIDGDGKQQMVDTICSFIESLGWRDYNPAITRKYVRGVVNYDRSPSCAWFQARSLCSGPCWREDGTLR